MPYVERVTKAGNTIEIERYFTSRYKKKGISRGDKVKPTKEEQEKVNTRQAERKLRILINANYGYGDYHLVLDYIRRKGEPDRTPEQMRQDIDVFLRECRKEYRKAGLEFKYIHVMEIGKKGARHHHLVVNKIDTEILQRCWYKAYEGHNRVKVFPLDDSGNYAELASYLIKYTGTHKKGTDGALQGKRWNCSKNLVRPEPEYHIISDREYFKKEPKAIKSWTDAASQLGAFTSLENAKSACKAGYTVYDDNGKAVYTAAGQQASAGVPFNVQVDILDLNIRTGAGTNYAKTGEKTGKGVFTIVEVKAGQGASVGWGRLKSGAGWISLDYATRLA